VSEAVKEQEPVADSRDLFSEDDMDALEEEFKEEGEASATQEGPKDEPTKEPEAKEEDEVKEFLEEKKEGEEEPIEPDTEGSDKARKDGDGDEESTEGDTKPDDYVYTLHVDGEEVEVESEEKLVDWAQKGMSLEKKSTETNRLAQDAQFTMNAIINDPMGFLEEMSVSQICGTRTPGFDDYESARNHVARICEKYLGPYLQEIAAPDTEKRAIKAERQLDQERKRSERDQQTQTEQYTQEDVEWMQNLQHDIDIALKEFDLPDTAPIKGRMASLMDEAIESGGDMHPQEAAKIISKEREEYLKSLGGSVSDDQSESKKKVAVKEAKANKSRKKAGVSKGVKRPRKKVASINSRDFMDRIDEAYGLDRY